MRALWLSVCIAVISAWLPAAVDARAITFASRTACDLYASPSADPALANGSRELPYRSVQAMVDRLESTEDGSHDKGCLLAGTYDENLVIHNKGTEAHHIYVESDCCASSARATLRGTVTLAADSQNVEVTALNIRGPGEVPAVRVEGDGSSVKSNDISSAGGTSCIVIGGERSPALPVVDSNLLHDCGSAPAPAVEVNQSPSFQFARNYVYGTPATALEVGPGVVRGRVASNLFYGNGAGVSYVGNSDSAPSRTSTNVNIISNSAGYNVGYDYPGPAGTGNRVLTNCLDGEGGRIQPGQPDVGTNTFAAPAYANPSQPPGGFAIPGDSACRGRGPYAVTRGVSSSTFFDPLRRAVGETEFRLGIIPAWQFPTFHFEYSAGADATPPLTSATPEKPLLSNASDPSRQYTGAASLFDLEPSQTYTVVGVVSSPFGTVRTSPQNLTLPPPVPLRPPYRVTMVTQSIDAARRQIDQVRVSRAPIGARVLIKCVRFVRGCPRGTLSREVTSHRPLKLLTGRRISTRATLRVFVEVATLDETEQPTPAGATPAQRGLLLAHRVTRETITSFRFHRTRAPSRSEVCVGAVREPFPCLEIAASTLGRTFRYVRASGVPPLATVRYTCQGGGCPHTRRAIVSDDFGQIEFREFRGRTLKPGAVLQVAVTRPKTIGAMALIRVHGHIATRRDGCTTVSSSSRIVPFESCPAG